MDKFWRLLHLHKLWLQLYRAGRLAYFVELLCIMLEEKDEKDLKLICFELIKMRK